MYKSIVVFFSFAVLWISVSADDEHVCDCNYSSKIIPVCASDNLTYDNPDEVECRNQCSNAGLTIVDTKPCGCSCTNSSEQPPVCADDDNTYVNSEAVACHNKCNYRQIAIKENKPCREGDKGLPY